MNMIGEINVSVIRLEELQYGQAGRKNKRVRRDYFENKLLKPNILQTQNQEYQSQQNCTLNEHMKQSLKLHKFQQTSQKIQFSTTPPKKTQSYRRTNRIKKTQKTPLKSQSMQKNKTNQQNSLKYQNSQKCQTQPQITHEINNFIFQEIEDDDVQKQGKMKIGTKMVKQHQHQKKYDAEFGEVKEENKEYRKINKIERKFVEENEKQGYYSYSLNNKTERKKRKNMFEDTEKLVKTNRQDISVSLQPRRKYNKLKSNNLNQNKSQFPLYANKSNQLQVISPQTQISKNKKSTKNIISKFFQMKILRQKKWNKEKYKLYSEANKQFLFCAFFQSRDEIYIYDKNVDFREGDPYILKLESNFMGTLIQVYTFGVTQKEAEVLGDQYQARVLYATIQTQPTSFFDEVKPRQFSVYFYNSRVNLKTLPSYIRKIPLNKLYMESDHYKQYITRLQNRKPEWDEIQNAHVLDMHNRADEPSIKNFILEDENHAEYLIFGKVSRDVYHLDCQPYFPPILAFAFSLSSFLYRNW